ncbi:trans-aconitate 2-methyltransferase [Actinopolymorpha alba]|uniref:trans-aconitate 2-methyltransferase n=1 Tax=Actinopolymorpha alba TaxID=533267 RepID=UPI0003617FEE|nr:trans-aconitate 2-methyltransferase [Actinopolymorpha alba]
MTDADGAVVWDPRQYLRYADERGRPFEDLLGRVRAETPGYVVDLGCGPGNLTATLLDRWPTATIDGVDSSVEMIERAQRLAVPGRLGFSVGDVRTWAPARPIDVLVSNATLQWVPGHLDLLPTWVGHLAPGGWLALQVPGNFDSPSHQTLFALAAEEPWASILAGQVRQRPSAPDAATYLEVLASAGCRVDAWETTYFHVLPGDDAVFEWVKGTGARPILQALPDEVRPEFEQTYKARLRAAYPPRDFGTVLPFRRIFAVAQRVAA